MLQFLSQQTILFYTMALICAWGVISQVVLRSMYGNLLRDVRRQGMAKGKFMKQLRQRYQNVCRMKQNTVNAFNTEAFIRKNLLEYRLFGGSLHTWKRMAQMAAILCAALGAVGWYISQPQAPIRPHTGILGTGTLNIMESPQVAKKAKRNCTISCEVIL